MQQGVKVLAFKYETNRFIALDERNNQYGVTNSKGILESSGAHFFNYIYKIMSTDAFGNNVRNYPICKVQVGETIYELGDMIRSNYPETNPNPYSVITKFEINPDFDNLVAFTANFSKNGLNVLKLEKEGVTIIEKAEAKGITYKIGDIASIEGEPYKISNFSKRNGKIVVLTNYLKYFDSETIYTFQIEELQGIWEDPNDPPRSFSVEPLLITEDGMNMFMGDTAFFVDKNFNITEIDVHLDKPEEICFSTEEAAQEYITKNIKIFCLQDLIDLELIGTEINAQALRNLIAERRKNNK